MALHRILLSCQGWRFQLLLGYARQTTETDMQDCWSFACCLSWTLGLSSKCIQLNSSMSITLVDIHLSWLIWLHIIIIVAGSLVVLIGCMIFLSAFLDVIRMPMLAVSFLAKLDSVTLPEVCFPLTYDLHRFKSRVNIQPFCLGFF